MEFNQYHHQEDQEVINNSDQETDNYDSLGVGRLYECVFCKRGFNTAQALGGHMNIHRRDRARNKPATSINPNKQQEEFYTGPRFYHQIPAAPSSYSYNNRVFASDHNKPLLSYATYFPPSTSDTNQQRSDENTNEFSDGDHRQPTYRSMVNHDEEWRLRLSLEFSSPAITEDLEENGHVAVNQKEDLDLELRLGSYDS